MSKVLKSAGILAICALLAKIIGALYRIPLTNIVGAEGIGLYQMVFPLYTVLLTISSGGLPVAISKVVSGKIAKNDEAGARQVLNVSLISLSVIGLIATLVIVVFRGNIAAIQGNEKAALPYLAIAPSIVLVCIISCFRGYYQGKQNMLPSALSQIIEQVIKLAAGLTFAKLFLPISLEMGVFGALFGVSISEFVALAVLLAQFGFTNYRYKKKSKVKALNLNFESAADLSISKTYMPKKNSAILKEIYKVAIPVTLGSLVMPITQVIDSILVINILVSMGNAAATATSLFGLATGPINSIINMPVVITLAMSTALMPKVSECFSRKENCLDTIEQSLKFSFIVGLLCSLILGVFAAPILRALYSKGLSKEQINIGIMLLQVGSISVLYVSILQVATAVLQGVNQAQKPAINLLFGAVLKVLFTLILLPIFGIAGAMAGTVICYGATCLTDVLAMRKYVKIKLNFKEFLLAPTLAGGVFVLSGILLMKLLSRVLPAAVAVISALVVAAVLFIAALALFGAIKKEEFADIPIIGKFIKKIGLQREKRREEKLKKKEELKH